MDEANEAYEESVADIRRERVKAEAALADEITRLRAENERLQIALNPRQWDENMHRAWQKELPDLQLAFSALRNASFITAPPAPVVDEAMIERACVAYFDDGTHGWKRFDNTRSGKVYRTAMKSALTAALGKGGE